MYRQYIAVCTYVYSPVRGGVGRYAVCVISESLLSLTSFGLVQRVGSVHSFILVWMWYLK